MLIVAGTMDVDPSEREAFLKSRESAMHTSRSEKGCIEYVFSADALDPGRVRLFEIWESKEDLAAHLAAMRSGGQAAPAGPRPTAANIQQYEVSAVGAVGS